MAPKARTPQRTPSKPVDITENNDTIVRPLWNTADNTLGEFLDLLLEWLPAMAKEYADLVTKYMVCERGKVYGISTNHTDMLRQGNLPLGTWKAPKYIKRADIELPKGFVTVSDASSVQASYDGSGVGGVVE